LELGDTADVVGGSADSGTAWALDAGAAWTVVLGLVGAREVAAPAAIAITATPAIAPTPTHHGLSRLRSRPVRGGQTDIVAPGAGWVG
jgi:hypothetical protein